MHLPTTKNNDQRDAIQRQKTRNQPYYSSGVPNQGYMYP